MPPRVRLRARSPCRARVNLCSSALAPLCDPCVKRPRVCLRRAGGVLIKPGAAQVFCQFRPHLA